MAGLMKDVMGKGTLLERPAASVYNEGYYYLQTDSTPGLYRSNGTTWELAATNGMANPMSASGDIVYGGASGAPTRLPKGTDGQVLTLAGGVPSWAASGGGAGASNVIINGLGELYDPALSSPNASDEDFETTDADDPAGWTVVNNTVNARNVHTTWKGHLYVKMTGNQRYTLKKALAASVASPTVVSVTACVRVPFGMEATPYIDLALGDDVSLTNAMSVRIYQSGGGSTTVARGKWSTATTYAEQGSKALSSVRPGKIYIHLQRTSRSGFNDVWEAWFSFDGFAWNRVLGDTILTYTATYVRLDLNANGQAQQFQEWGVDFVRVNWKQF